MENNKNNKNNEVGVPSNGMNKTVKIYSTPTCVYCRMAKDFFKKNSINYQEFNVAEDEKAREEMVQKSGQLGVPVINIDNEILVGFDESALRKALGL